MATRLRGMLAAAFAALAATAGTASAGGVESLRYDLRYAQLSPDEQQVVRSRYEALAPEDEPPYPVDGIGTILRPLLQSAHHIRMDGWVDAIADVGPDGNVRSVSVYQSPDPVVITPLLSRLLLLQKFKPGLCKGTPCAMPFALRLDLATR